MCRIMICKQKEKRISFQKIKDGVDKKTSAYNYTENVKNNRKA